MKSDPCSYLINIQLTFKKKTKVLDTFKWTKKGLSFSEGCVRCYLKRYVKGSVTHPYPQH